MRFAWGKTFILGVGFLAISAVASLYDSYMPKFYEGFISSSMIVGLIMGIDNFLGMTLQPYFGALSDRTNSKWGRRRPYLLIGAPIAAVAIMAVPFARDSGLMPLLLMTIFLNLALSVFRSPTVALMPDLTPSAHRSVANGVINLMGGVGAAISLLVGSMLYKMNPRYPFLMVGVIMLLAVLLFLFFIREPAVPHAGEGSGDESPQSMFEALKEVVTNPDRNTLLLFLAIFMWFVGYQSVNTWFTTYSEQQLGVEVQQASRTLITYAGAFIVGAIPAGYIANKIGRRRTITIGLVGMATSFLILHFLTSLQQMSIALIIGGFFWALVNINSYPMVVEMCSPKQTGTYTGLYYIFSGIAGVLGPFITGTIFDLFGSKRPLFITAAIAMVAALVLISAVRKGEAAGQET